MIDPAQLFKQLQALQEPLFIDYKHEREQVNALWQQCVVHEVVYGTLKDKAKQPLAYWAGSLGFKQLVEPVPHYQILALDGSQIYPDRHEGIRVALINVGGIWLSYSHSSQAQFFCQPYVFLGDAHDGEFVAAKIDAKRHEHELSCGVEKAVVFVSNIQAPLLVLFDGALIFWHLENNSALYDHYFMRYCKLIQQLRDLGVLCAWYTSLPNSRDLIRILREYAQQNHLENFLLNNCNDHDVMQGWLNAHERTTTFESVSSLAQKYPAAVRPYFFYLHSGAEIARVEVPYWLACDDAKLNLISALIVDQCIKGDGYPVSLAEAHAQVVVTQPDRELFQKLIYQMANDHHMPIRVSRKQMKKQSLFS